MSLRGEDDNEVSIALIASLKALESMPFDCPPPLQQEVQAILWAFHELIQLLFLDYAVGHKFRGSPPMALRRLHRRM